MVNLNIYENVIISHFKTWINPIYKRLYSREIPNYSAYTILKKYNSKERCYDFYLVITNKLDEEHNWNTIYETRSGISKINLSYIWNFLPIHDKEYEFEVLIKKVDEDDNSIIYYLDI